MAIDRSVNENRNSNVGEMYCVTDGWVTVTNLTTEMQALRDTGRHEMCKIGNCPTCNVRLVQDLSQTHLLPPHS